MLGNVENFTILAQFEASYWSRGNQMALGIRFVTC